MKQLDTSNSVGLQDDSVTLIDTHCHIHDSEMSKRYDVSQDELLENAKADGVRAFVMVGTDVQSSKEALSFVTKKAECYASLALHPHEAADMTIPQMNDAMNELRGLYSNDAKVVAIGETGLDYYYHDSTEVIDRQKQLFRSHIEMALELDLPMIFHIRDAKISHQETDNSTTLYQTTGSAFGDFFAIIDEYNAMKNGKKIRGVVHSFTAGTVELQGCIDRGLYVGLNGIMTFTTDLNQLEAAKAVDLSNMLLETDAPFLTPKPFRGKMCEPKHVRVTAEFLSQLRGESTRTIADATTANARTLFGI